MARERNFVILTHGRTGSSLLTMSLREMGLALAGEIFHEEADSRADAMVRGLPAYDPAMDGADFVRRLFSAVPGAVGFKLFYEQARSGPAATVWDYLAETPGIAVIHLIRRDLLAAWVSYERASRSGVWITPADDPRPADAAPFNIDAQDLERFFDRVTASRSWVREVFAGRDYMELTYEDDIRDDAEGALDKIARFVGASDLGPPRAVLERLSSGDPTRHIANFDELARRFRHTPHEEFFWKRRQFMARGAHPGFCSKPFESFTVDARGTIRVCCEDWLAKPIGDARKTGLLAQWNSNEAQAIRASILDGSYRYCDRTRCPDLVKNALPRMDEVSSARHRAWIDGDVHHLEEPPAHLSLGYDPSCNLKCPTCREDFIVLKDAAFAQAEKIHAEVVGELMPHARRALITGQGDAFSSRLYRRFMREFDAQQHPGLKIALMTNGLTLTPAMWASMSRAHGAISGVSISIDAATPETYAVNRGGDFDKLIRNLEFLAGLQRSGKLGFLEISFVVQANNFAEMPGFVDLGKHLGCEQVLFMKLIFWPGTFPQSEWAQRAIHQPDHPDHGRFLETLRTPQLLDPIVDLSNLADLAPRRTAG